MADGGHQGEGEHDERDVTVPTMPRSGFVVFDTEFVFGGLEAVSNRPTMALNLD
jgi:hypothetical protein